MLVLLRQCPPALVVERTLFATAALDRLAPSLELLVLLAQATLEFLAPSLERLHATPETRCFGRPLDQLQLQRLAASLADVLTHEGRRRERGLEAMRRVQRFEYHAALERYATGLQDIARGAACGSSS